MIIKGKINNKQICPMNIYTNTTPNENLITKKYQKNRIITYNGIQSISHYQKMTQHQIQDNQYLNTAANQPFLNTASQQINQVSNSITSNRQKKQKKKNKKIYIYERD